MEIKSSLINDSTFSEVKKSLIMASLVDGKEKFRVKMMEYINDTADNSNDMFFYDMLEFVRFLNPAEDAIAYTDESKLIYLNSPGKPGESVRIWDFIYCHECLHQLWDTFGVADKLKSEGIEYNHNILNVASDCVINDYLSYNRKKEMYENGISPKYLKDKFDVEYDRKIDTQYSLYLKLMEKKKEIENDPICQQSFDGKIKPKSVSKNNNGGDGGFPIKHSKDYIDGWTNAIQDTLDKKIDPLDKNRKLSNTGNKEYDTGYEDCMAQLKKGLEEGVELSKSNGGNSGGDLPPIPWDIDNDSNNGSSDDNSSNSNSSSDNESANDAANRAQKAANSAKQKANDAKSNNDPNADDLEKAAKEAQSEADKAKEAAKKANEASKNGDKNELDKQTKAAQSAADKAESASGEYGSDSLSDTISKAKDAAKSARDAANKAKEMAKAAKGTSEAKEKQENAEAAEKHAKEAEDAAKEAEKEAKSANNSTGKTSENHKKAAEKAAERAEESAAAAKAKIGEGNENNDSKHPSHGAGKSGNRTIAKERNADIDEITKKANDIIEKYRNKISGVFGEFINKCKASKELKKSGLAVNVQRGATGWNNKMNEIVNQYVRTKVFKAKQQYERTYNRVKRGSGFIKFGNPIEPGVQRKHNLLTINVAFYIDNSGSMGESVNRVFDATYIISEALNKHFSKEKVVDDITFKIFAFNTHFQEIKFGKRCNSSGGTMSFQELLSGIKDRTDDHLINIIITDAEFSNINETEVNKFLKDISGLVVFITNNQHDTRVKDIAKKHPNKLEFILADSNFSIK